MKRTLLATSLVMALGAGTAHAGVIQIDPTGSGSIGGSIQLGGLGSSIGDLLLDDLIVSSRSTAGTVWGQNVIDISTTALGGELTLVFGFTAFSAPQTLPGGGTNLFSADISLATGADSTVNFFDLYWDPDPAGAGTVANTKTGLGYDDAVHLASGTVKIVKDSAGTEQFGVSQQSGGTSALADNDPTPTVPVTGSARLEVDFDPAKLNTAYVVNDLAGLIVDLDASNSLNAPYTATDVRSYKGYADGEYAATTVGKSSFSGSAGVGKAVGSDGFNDFACNFFSSPGSPGDPNLGGTCDMQLQMNTTVTFRAPPVPEPATLALMGLGLGLFGFSRRLASRSS